MAVLKAVSTVGGKQIEDVLGSASKVTTHENKTDIHVTSSEKTTWNAKSNLALGETSVTAYRGDRGKLAYDHSLVAHAPSNANNYVHPANHPPSIITQDASNRFVTDTEKTTWNSKLGASDLYVTDSVTSKTYSRSFQLDDGEVSLVFTEVV